MCFAMFPTYNYSSFDLLFGGHIVHIIKWNTYALCLAMP